MLLLFILAGALQYQWYIRVLPVINNLSKYVIFIYYVIWNIHTSKRFNFILTLICKYYAHILNESIRVSYHGFVMNWWQQACTPTV